MRITIQCRAGDFAIQYALEPVHSLAADGWERTIVGIEISMTHHNRCIIVDFPDPDYL